MHGRRLPLKGGDSGVKERNEVMCVRVCVRTLVMTFPPRLKPERKRGLLGCLVGVGRGNRSAQTSTCKRKHHKVINLAEVTRGDACFAARITDVDDRPPPPKSMQDTGGAGR